MWTIPRCTEPFLWPRLTQGGRSIRFRLALAGDIGILRGPEAEGATAPETLRQKDRASY